uniref:Sushi, von Willebrand factor type A, EGF and pentraxin domain-containing protein 1 n=1 Tax=Branchiostoma floridae TaxID=7739 RepID=C3ZCU7_BRAFL|eukprot:XP_002593589.1 hypothetical protein BRAFLDRAFT_88162 [Branchiostoma floridae]
MGWSIWLPSSLEKTLKQIGSANDSHQLRERVHNMQQQTNLLVSETARCLKQLSSMTRGAPKPQKLQVDRLSNEFKQSVQRYGIIQKGFLDDDYGDESTSLLEEEQQRRRVEELQRQEQVIDFEGDIIREREERIREIEPGPPPAAAHPDTIEANVEKAYGNVESGNKQLEKASQYQIRRKLLSICTQPDLVKECECLHIYGYFSHLSYFMHDGHGWQAVWRLASRDTHASAGTYSGHRSVGLRNLGELRAANTPVEPCEDWVLFSAFSTGNSGTNGRKSGRWRSTFRKVLLEVFRKRRGEKDFVSIPTSVTCADEVTVAGQTDVAFRCQGVIFSLWLQSVGDVHNNAGPMMLLQLTLLAPLHLLLVAGSKGQPLPPCGGYLEGSRNGTITSPNFPSAHKTPLECIWTIRNPKPGRHYIYVYLLQNYLSCQSSALTYLEYQSVSNLTDSYIYSSNFNSRNDCGGSLHRIRSSKAFLQVKLTSMLTRLSSTSSGLYGFNATYTTIPTDNQPMPICSQSCSEAGFCRSLQDYSGFYCECFEGFSGRHCQYNDICDYRRRLNPCLNNGTCTVVKYGAQTSVVCACQRGYLGERCEKIITCPLLQDPPNGKVSPPPCRDSRSRVGETCYFTCDNTYVQSGPSFKTCLSDGYWTQEKESTVCRDVTPPYFGDTCPGDMNLKNKRCENKVLLNFTVPTAVDNSGYVKVDGPETKPPIYLAGGQYTWIYTASDASNNEARCQIAIGVQVVKCPTIKVPHNGEVTSKSCGSLYGSEVQFVCKEGFKLMGTGIRTCGPNGEWEGGDVQCIAQLGDGIEKPHKRPGKPRDLHIVAKGPRMVKLSWLPPVAYRGTKRTKIAYKVQFQSKRLRITWTDLFKELLISGTRITLPLSPWVDYTFRVIAADRSADSEPSEPSELYETPPAPPGRIPERIRVNGVSPTSFRVSWKTLPLLDHNGPALRYLVSWRLHNETCWTLNLWKTATVVGPRSSYVVENITSGLLYEVTVQAVNSVGQGPVSAPLHGQSLPALKDAPILTAPVREYNTSITSTIELNCPVLGAVQSRRLWYNEARIVPTKLIQHTGALLLDTVHFKDEGCYKCYAENDHGSTEGCRCLRVYGAPYTPFKLELSDKRATSVILSWTPWPSDHRPSEHFIVQYQTTFEPSIWREMIGFVPGNATKSLLELSPFVNYRFRVIAVNWVGRSDPSGASESYHTPPSAPEVFPKNIQAQGIYTRDLDVRWDPLGWYERNGPGVQYKIFWRILYCNDDLLADWESSVVQGEEKSSYIILNLIRDLPYQVQVQVLNNQGAGPISYPPVIGHAGGEG